MPAVPVAMTGVIYPLNKKDPPMAVFIQGNAYRSDLGVGGGPVPPQLPVDPGYSPPWARPPEGQPPRPIHPIWGPPGFNPPGEGMPPGIGGGPIYPPEQLPPEVEVPPPGSPPVVLGGNHPVQPIVAPAFIVVQYPGVGWVMVPNPVTGESA